MRVFLFALAWLGSTTAWAAGDAAAGKALYAVCAACHGQQGEGNQPLGSPKLAGREDWYLLAQLKAYKDGLRGTKPGDTFGAQMRPMAMTLANDAAMANVVAYIKTFTPKPPAQTVKGDATKGQQLYAVCLACHGAKGEGNKALNSPSLAGLNDWYLVTQLKNYRAGLRGSDPKDILGMQMAPMAKTLANDQAILDVVSHINTFK